MAVTSKPSSRSAKMVVSITKEGKSTTSSKSYGHVKADASDSAIYNTIEAIADLQKHPLANVFVVTTNEIEETA